MYQIIDNLKYCHSRTLFSSSPLFFKVAYPHNRGYMGGTMGGGMQLDKKGGWKKSEYASGTISGLLASTQKETSFICDNKDSLLMTGHHK